MRAPAGPPDGKLAVLPHGKEAAYRPHMSDVLQILFLMLCGVSRAKRSGRAQRYGFAHEVSGSEQHFRRQQEQADSWRPVNQQYGVLIGEKA